MIYFVASGLHKPIKIGYAKDPWERCASLQTGNPDKLSVIHWCSGDKTLEKCFHQIFSDFRVHGEWFEWKPVVAFIENVWQAYVPNTEVGIQYPFAVDGCRECDEARWSKSTTVADAGQTLSVEDRINWPESIQKQNPEWIRFRYRCIRGHTWTCGYSSEAAKRGFYR